MHHTSAIDCECVALSSSSYNVFAHIPCATLWDVQPDFRRSILEKDDNFFKAVNYQIYFTDLQYNLHGSR